MNLRSLGCAAILLVSSCARLLPELPVPTVEIRGHLVPIDLVPRYGDVDRSQYPLLAEADRNFIQGVTREFGSREAACVEFSDYGVRKYLEDDLDTALRRFNQAWLLAPDNPAPHYGFALVMYDVGNLDLALPHLRDSLELGLDQHIPLADAGLLFAHAASLEDGDAHQGLAEEARRAVALAEELTADSDLDYVVDKRMRMHLFLGEFAEAQALIPVLEGYGWPIERADREALKAGLEGR